MGLRSADSTSPLGRDEMHPDLPGFSPVPVDIFDSNRLRPKDAYLCKDGAGNHPAKVKHRVSFFNPDKLTAKRRVPLLGAGGGTRTRTDFRPPAPQAGASTDSTTPAYGT